MGFHLPEEAVLPRVWPLLLIASDVPTDAELTEIKSSWMWDPVKEKTLKGISQMNSALPEKAQTMVRTLVLGRESGVSGSSSG